MIVTHKMDVEGFFEPTTGTISYVVSDPATARAAVIDPVLDYDPDAGRITTHSLDLLCTALDRRGLALEWILETHVHADHLSAAAVLKKRRGGRLGIGARVPQVQVTLSQIFGTGPEVPSDGSQFDMLFADGADFSIGAIPVRVMETPGHTPACVTYLVGDAAFVGDTLFMPDYGTARCDFPGGDAAALYRSVQSIYRLPAETRLFLCHDYPPAGRGPEWESSVAAQRAHNVHLRDGVSEAEFVALRHARDAKLAVPHLILPSLQVNMRAGALPSAEANGTAYLKIPLNLF